VITVISYAVLSNSVSHFLRTNKLISINRLFEISSYIKVKFYRAWSFIFLVYSLMSLLSHSMRTKTLGRLLCRECLLFKIWIMLIQFLVLKKALVPIEKLTNLNFHLSIVALCCSFYVLTLKTLLIIQYFGLWRNNSTIHYIYFFK
jgi:hypothetical protein